MILYIVMIGLYVTLTIFQVYAVLKQRNRNLLVFLFTTSLIMHSLSFFFSTLHKIVFAQNGTGYGNLAIIADVVRILSLVSCPSDDQLSCITYMSYGIMIHETGVIHSVRIDYRKGMAHNSSRGMMLSLIISYRMTIISCVT